MIDGLLGPDVAICTSGHDHAYASLLPTERLAVENAVSRRQVEFASGRYCARRAMEAVGIAGVSIPMADDRSPQWPAEIVGSISHCRTRCIAAVARKSNGFLSLGIDIEDAAELDENLWHSICRPEELDALSLLSPQRRGLAATTIFSAKEAVYKCQYPLTGLMLDFLDVSIALSTDTFVGRILIDHPALPTHAIEGRIREAEGYVVTGAAMTTGVPKL